jgi:hypothetical protein
MVSRRTLAWLLAAAIAVFLWNAVATEEVATLYVPAIAGTEDHFARVWVVDASPFVWIRAGKPNTPWLEAVRRQPDVMLYRGERRTPYRAQIREDPESVAYTDVLFRMKYGVLDRLRSLVHRGRPLIPVRLKPR